MLIPQVGPDLLFTGYLPTSGGPEALEAILLQSAPTSLGSGRPLPVVSMNMQPDTAPGATASAATTTSSVPSTSSSSNSSGVALSPQRPVLLSRAGPQGPVSKHPVSNQTLKLAHFYKAWDEWGALSNFSPHPIMIQEDGHRLV